MLLSLAIWVPISAGLLVLVCGGDRNAPMQRAIVADFDSFMEHENGNEKT